MNKNTFSALAIAAALAMTLSAPIAEAAPLKGSPAAAQQVVAQLLSLIYGVPPEQVQVTQPVIDGATAQMTATVADKTCTILVSRDDSQNQYGWVVKSPNCGR